MSTVDDPELPVPFRRRRSLRKAWPWVVAGWTGLSVFCCYWAVTAPSGGSAGDLLASWNSFTTRGIFPEALVVASGTFFVTLMLWLVGGVRKRGEPVRSGEAKRAFAWVLLVAGMAAFALYVTVVLFPPSPSH